MPRNAEKTRRLVWLINEGKRGETIEDASDLLEAHEWYEDVLEKIDRACPRMTGDEAWHRAHTARARARGELQVGDLVTFTDESGQERTGYIARHDYENERFQVMDALEELVTGKNWTWALWVPVPDCQRVPRTQVVC